jgi:hypothetical protein
MEPGCGIEGLTNNREIDLPQMQRKNHATSSDGPRAKLAIGVIDG